MVPPSPRYLIRTASGDKGPFSSAQIAAFVEQGKLPAAAKILDIDQQRPVVAGDVADDQRTATAEPDAEPGASIFDTGDTPEDGRTAVDAEPTEQAPPERRQRPLTTTRRKSRTRQSTLPETTVSRRGRGTTERGRSGRPKKRSGNGWIAAVIVLVLVLIIGVVVVMQVMKQDKFVDQDQTLLTATLADPSPVAPSGGSVSHAYLQVLIKKFHPQALAAATLPRGTYEGYKPHYDAAKYRDALRAPIAEQIAHPDTAVLDESAASLIDTDVEEAKALAQQAVTLDQEKNPHSLHTLARALAKSGDARRAQVIEEQARQLTASPASPPSSEPAATMPATPAVAPAVPPTSPIAPPAVPTPATPVSIPTPHAPEVTPPAP